MVEGSWDFVEKESVVSVHDLVEARGRQSVVARALETLNVTLRVQVVKGEVLDRLAVVQQELVVEAAGLVAERWLVKAEGVMDEDTAVEAVDSIVEAVGSTAGVATVLLAVETAQVAEAVFVAENPDVVGKGAPTSASQALATEGSEKAAMALPLLAYLWASEAHQMLAELE